MRILEYLPHRLLANRSLRIESERLRSEYDKAEKEFEINRRKCGEIIEAAQREADKQTEDTVNAINDQLKTEAENLQSLENDLSTYAHLFFDHRFLEIKRDSCKSKLSLIEKQVRFLSAQMTIIGNEVDELEKLKDNLAQRASVDDIVELLNLSGYSVPGVIQPTAKTLLSWVDSLINQIEGGSIERATLKKLRRSIQEREDLLPLIKYIGWIIEQKKALSRECKRERDRVSDSQPEAEKQLQQCEQELSESETRLNQAAQVVRYYWAKPLIPIQIEKSYLHYQKEKARAKKHECISNKRKHIEENKGCWEEIREMKRVKSDDDFKWKRLHDEADEHNTAIESLDREIKANESQIVALKSQIQKNKEEAEYWIGIKKTIINLLKSNSAPLIEDKWGTESDEYVLLSRRLSELEEIVAQDEILAKQKQKADKDALITERKEALDRISDQIAVQNAAWSRADSDCKAAASFLAKAQQEDKQTRGLISRLFFKSEAEKKPWLGKMKQKNKGNRLLKH